MTAALDILHREHRAIAAVLHCLSHIVEETRAGKLAPEFEFFDAVISYMRDFPDRMHHPKEDEFFFKVLRTKAPELVPTLDALHEEHVAGDRLLAELDQKLDDWRKASEDTDRASAFLDEADAYVARQGLDLPEEPQARIIDPDPDCMTAPLAELDLAEAGVTTIIWATGFEVDYSWLEADVFDERGRPIHQRGVSAEQGLYFLGQSWQSRRGSAFIWGVWHDAKYLADQIAIQESYRHYHPSAQADHHP